MKSIFLNSKVLLLSLIVFYFCRLEGQEKNVSIQSNIDSAKIFINSKLAGTAPLSNYKFMEDSLIIIIYDAEPDNWDTQKATYIVKTDTTIKAFFRKKIYIKSEPENASVFSDNIFLGFTPIILTYAENEKKEIKLKKDKYRDYSFLTGSTESKNIHITLNGIDEIPENPIHEREDGFFSRKNLNYFIIGGLVSGLISGYTKIKADDYEEDYNNGDKSSKNKVYTYDTISNISLVAFECCLLTVNYILLKD